MRPFSFSSPSEECLYCGEDAMSENDPEAPKFIEDIPKGYHQLVESFQGTFEELTVALKDRRRKLMEQAISAVTAD
jgi:hypothetical protein